MPDLTFLPHTFSVEVQLDILLLRRQKHIIRILVTQWFQFSTQFCSPVVMSTSSITKSLSLFYVFFSDLVKNYCVMDLAFVFLTFFFTLNSAPNLGNSSTSTQLNQSKGCRDLEVIQVMVRLMSTIGSKTEIEI